MLCLISFFPQVSLALSQPKAQVSTTTMYNITWLLRVYVFNVVIIYLFVGEKYRSYHSIPTFDFPALNFFFSRCVQDLWQWDHADFQWDQVPCEIHMSCNTDTLLSCWSRLFYLCAA